VQVERPPREEVRETSRFRLRILNLREMGGIRDDVRIRPWNGAKHALVAFSEVAPVRRSGAEAPKT
jgi:hypothetical protein